MKQKRSNFKRKILLLAAVMAAIPSGLHAQGAGPAIIRDTEIETTLKGWAEPLQKAAATGEVNIILVQSSQINAFVAGGKNVFLYTGLIGKTEGPGELVGVMAHEIGHIAGGHLIAGKAAMEQASYESVLGAVLGIGAAILSGNGGAAQAVMSGANSMATGRFLAHSRVKESSADQAAISYMKQSGFDPTGMSSFLGKLEAEELLPASQQSEYMRTHPITRDRIEAVNGQIAASGLSGKPFPAEWNEQHARMKAKLAGFITPQQVTWTYPDQDKSIAARYARAIAAYRLNDIQGALKQIDGLIEAEPANPYFQELKGQVLVESSRVAEGVPYYRAALKKLPEADLIRVALAHALIESPGGDQERARLEEAITHLKRAQKREDRSARIHRLLATAYGRTGHEDIAKLELAEEALLLMNLDYAQSLAEQALGTFPEGGAEWVKARDILMQVERLRREKDE